MSAEAAPARAPMWKTFLRLALSGLALWLVSRRVDLVHSLELIRAINPWWLLPAALAFVLSHVCSSERSRHLWRAGGLDLSRGYAWRLYWLGAFYSLFLPGGVGGDGYKIYLLRRHTGTATGTLVQAGLLDRGYGVAAILWLALLLALAVIPGLNTAWSLVALALSWPVLGLLLRLGFARFRSAFVAAVGLSLLKQVLQAAAAAGLLMALGGPYHHGYPLAFLLSSLALLLPISVGGMGARELVLSYLPPSFPIDEEVAVSMSLLFFLFSALYSLLGAAVQALPVQYRGAPPEARAKPDEGPD